MNHSISIILLFCLVISITSLPLKVSKNPPKPGKNIGNVNNAKKEKPFEVFSKILEVNKGLKNSRLQVTQGDILKRKGRYALGCTSCLWPKSSNGLVLVPLNFSNYMTDHQKLIMNAIQEYESLTCVRFINRTSEVNYLLLSPSNGCASYVGRIGGAQSVQLEAPSCMSRGVIQHELNHALGFLHETSRSDRDDYIIVNFQNIAPGSETNFAILDGNDLGLPYDYTSVMHYSKNAFSINSSSLPTIVPTPDPNVPIGQRSGLSVLDVAKINKLYNCNVCSTLLNTPSGSFSSANYPSNYPNNMNCVWLIRIPDGQVSLTFSDFNLQNTPGCNLDYIKIYDGPSRNSSLILNRICGSSQVPTIVGTTNQMLIEFVTDSAITATGFSASYNTVPCGGTFFAAKKEITSPGYYSPMSYQPNMNCDFNIYAPPGFKVSLNGSYDIESTTLCNDDRLTVYAGKDMGSPTSIYCGNSSFLVNSQTNRVLLNFKSDAYIQQRGFTVTYSIFM